MSGTDQQKPNFLRNGVPPCEDFTTVSRPTLKRVNTPPGLNLFNFMTSDPRALAAIHQHKRSQSAVAPEAMINGSESARLSMRPGTSASAMSALQMDNVRSPCFVHKTFGSSINLERVLDQCRAEEMTHHNLLQTATGVREVARQLGSFPTSGCANYRSYGDQDENQKRDDRHESARSWPRKDN
jgi:hypothetical protein